MEFWLLISASSWKLSGLLKLEKTWSNTKKLLLRKRKKHPQNSDKNCQNIREGQNVGQNSKSEVIILPLFLQVLQLKYNWFSKCLDKVLVLIVSFTMARNGLNCQEEWGPSEYVHQVSKRVPTMAELPCSSPWKRHQTGRLC